MKRILSLVLALATLGLASAQATLKIILPSARPAGMDQVVAEAEKRMAADGLNVKLDITFVPWSDLGQKTQIILASGESVDLIFDAPWLHLPQMVAKGYYEELGPLLKKDAPHILKAVPQELFDANSYDGKVVALPLTNAYLSGRQFLVRQDLREKLGVAPLKSWDDIVKFAYLVKQKEPSMIPFESIGGGGGFNWFITYACLDTKNKMVSIQGTNNYTLYLKNNDGKVYNLFETKDPFIYGAFKQARKFYKDGIFDPDILSVTNGTAAIESGKYAVVAMNDFGVSSQTQANLAKNVPGAKYEMATFWSTRPGDYVSDFKAWNFIAVPKVSKNKDLAIKFLDWVMTSQDNYDLLAYGIKGKDWEPVGEGAYRALGSDYAWFPFAWIWNTSFDRINAGTAQEMQLNKFLRVPANFTKSKLIGFTWDPSPVANEVSRLAALESKYWPLLVQGVADTDQTFASFQKEAGGIAKKIQAEYQRQIDAFLAAKK